MHNSINQQSGIVVFDLGGTYFRSGLYTIEKELIAVSQIPALSFRSAPELPVKQLQQGLVDYLVSTARTYTEKYKVEQVAISFGAALDGRRGVIYGSGPLWGDAQSEFDVLSILNTAAPELNWVILNDVTAALICYANEAVARSEVPELRKLLLLTVSTGIACRVYDMRQQRIVLDEFGLQGEIGHLPISLNYQGEVLELRCDCGEGNHVAAFCSGRGIAQLTLLLAERQPALWRASQLFRFHEESLSPEAALLKALTLHDEFASTIMSLATQPIAGVLRHTLSLDPEIDRIVLTGGVAENLGEYYRNALLQNLAEHGLYLTSQFDPNWFERRLRIANRHEVHNLKGAALYAVHHKEHEYYV